MQFIYNELLKMIAIIMKAAAITIIRFSSDCISILIFGPSTVENIARKENFIV